MCFIEKFKFKDTLSIVLKSTSLTTKPFHERYYLCFIKYKIIKSIKKIALATVVSFPSRHPWCGLPVFCSHNLVSTPRFIVIYLLVLNRGRQPSTICRL